MSMKHWCNGNWKGKNSAQRKACSSTALSATKLNITALVLKLSLCSEKPATAEAQHARVNAKKPVNIKFFVINLHSIHFCKISKTLYRL